MTDALETTSDDINVERNEVEEIIEEAKASFIESGSLIDNIKNRDMRTVKIDLGYDEVNSEKLIGIEAALGQLRNILDQAERNGSGVDELKKVVAKLKRDIKKANAEDAGEIQDQIEEGERQISERIALLEQMAPLRAKQIEMDMAADEVRALVNKESLSIELRAIPYKIARGAARRARKTLGLTEKGIPEDRQDEFEEQQLLELAFDMVGRFRDNRNGRSGTKLSLEEIETIRDFMPISQSSKFFAAVNDLQFRNAISESAIAQADF
ncbi:hypothetical protein [Frigoribacterium sp. CG_9.8]|uniref:hypothetical protein n=1 Tax=Frigoribacterium sp. CG_9.8 TaxID=2787733 RepID=UPI0018C8EE9E|nr:hypothetical protein [Frigoribacterium sp. CG_9.8]MBG6106639.1 hypothetical protein [Frigoribacterium sp. CG_9.8]